MSQLYKAYAAVHDSDARENLIEIRDEISGMTLTSLMDADLQTIAEDILERLLFEKDMSIPNAEALMQHIFAEASKGDGSAGRMQKIHRLQESFVQAFSRVTETAPTRAKEGFTEYRYRKQLGEKREDLMSVDRGKVKLHNSLTLEERNKVFNGLLQMIEKSETPGQQLAQKKKDDDLFGSPNVKKSPRFKVSKADERANTEAWKRYKAGNPNYTKEEVVNEVAPLAALAPLAAKVAGSAAGKAAISTAATTAAGNIADRATRGPEPQAMNKGGIVKKKYVSVKKEEVELSEKQKDTPDQVKAVIAYDRARKATDDATYDSIHGDKKQAKKEKDYAKWQRDKGARDAQKSGHPWEHAKGSTREKEGKKSVKHVHVKDSYESQGEVIAEKDLDAAERRALPDKDFALPGKGKGPEGKQAGSYPIPDKSHARMALAMVAKHGTSEEKSKVRAAVEKKFPGIKVSEEVQQLVNSERFSQEEILRLISD